MSLIISKRQIKPIFPGRGKRCHDKPIKNKEASRGKERVKRGRERGILEGAYTGVEQRGNESGRVLPTAETEPEIIYILEEEVEGENISFICTDTDKASAPNPCRKPNRSSAVQR
ncbi:MAG: hypothetical protein VST71_00660 [Nitrospirota bacterium]|nr:hypothetical protein [Nitrospirota bacterium]